MTGYPGSWMAPIGGILASVTPKHRSEVKLDDKVRPEKESHVRVTGLVAPVVKDQPLRVDMTRPDGSVATTAARIDDHGRFTAVFDLTQKGKRPGTPQNKGATYAFQAHLINAPQLAPADSNIVWYRIGDRDKEEQPTDDRSDEERKSSEWNPPSLK